MGKEVLTENTVTKLRRARQALRLIANVRCENYTADSCRDAGSGRKRNGYYGADRWCNTCIAHEGLERSK